MPVVLVMAQCSAARLRTCSFTAAIRGGALIERNVVGFFSAQKDREGGGLFLCHGAGRLPGFLILFRSVPCVGQDRFGDRMTGADYDGDGTVSLHEAFCYALIHDRSADTPICTSDVFLWSRASLPDATIYGTPYPEVHRAATPAQRAVLEALSQQLGLEGEARAITVFDRLTYGTRQRTRHC